MGPGDQLVLERKSRSVKRLRRAIIHYAGAHAADEDEIVDEVQYPSATQGENQGWVTIEHVRSGQCGVQCAGNEQDGEDQVDVHQDEARAVLEAVRNGAEEEDKQ